MNFGHHIDKIAEVLYYVFCSRDINFTVLCLLEQPEGCITVFFVFAIALCGLYVEWGVAVTWTCLLHEKTRYRVRTSFSFRSFLWNLRRRTGIEKRQISDALQIQPTCSVKGACLRDDDR
jgi:hypothetical protein